jgi:hypothetical protein
MQDGQDSSELRSTVFISILLVYGAWVYSNGTGGAFE